MIKKFIKQFSIYFSVDIFIKGSSFFLLAFYLKHMSLLEYGIVQSYVLIKSIMLLFFNFNGKWILFNKFQDVDFDKKRLILTNIIVLTTLIALFLTFIINLFYLDIIKFLISNNNYIHLQYFKIFLVIEIFLNIPMFFKQHFIINNQAKLVSFFDIIFFLINAIASVALILFFSLKYMALIYSNLIADFILFVIYCIYIWKYIKFSKISLKEIKNLLKIGYYSGIKSSSSFILKKIDQLMVQKLLGLEALAIYSVILKIYNIVDNFQSLVGKVYVGFAKRDNNKILLYDRQIINRHTYIKLLLVFINMGILLVIYIFGKDLIKLLTNNISNEVIAVKTLLIWLLVPILSQSFAYYSLYLLLNSKYKFILSATFLAGLMNIFLNYVLIPKIGIMGAAISSVLSISIEILILYIYGRKNFGQLFSKLELIGLINFVFAMFLILNYKG